MATLTAQGVTDALQSVCGSPAAQGVEGAPQFRKELNLALPRLYNMGLWRDLLFEHVVSTSDGTFTIPDHAESIVAALLDPTGDSVDYSYPQKIRAQFHDYNIVGRNDRDGENTLASFGIVDDGYSPTIEEIKPISDLSYTALGYKLLILPVFPAMALPTGVSDTFIEVDFTVAAGSKTEKFVLNGQSFLSTTDVDISSAQQVKTGGTDLGADVDVVAIPVAASANDQAVTLSGTTIKQTIPALGLGASTTIIVPLTDVSGIKVGDILSFSGWANASVSGGSSGAEIDGADNYYPVTGIDKTKKEVYVYRSTSQYNLWTATGGESIILQPTTKLATLREPNKVGRYRRYRVDVNNKKASLRLLLKRKFTSLLEPTDLIHISSLSAIKHAMLGNIAEENADLERANYHWSVCRGVLDEQLDAHRGAAKPAVRFDPTGSGGTLLNIM
mgnify:CR=1 FL=1